MILIVDRRDTVVRYQSGRLHIERDGETVQRYPVNQLEQVVVYGNPLVESAVWRALATAGVPAVLLTTRGAQQAAMLGSGLAVQLPLRRLQHRCADCEESSLAMARHFIQGKFRSYELALDALVAWHAGDATAIRAFVEQCDHARTELSSTETHDGLLGREGQVAHAWFELLKTTLPNQWDFSGRNRRPPRDPVNALLSLGYTLLMSEVRQALIASGMDPSLGFLHRDYPGREGSVLDFTELFRSGVDRFVLGWVAHTQLDQSSFYYREDKGCRLSKAARPLFYKAWATYRENWPRPWNDPAAEPWPRAPIQEQVLGQVANVRAKLKEVMGVEDEPEPHAS